MTRIARPFPGRSRLWPCVVGAALLVGIFLRLQQVGVQVLIDDEWHAVHQLLAHTPSEMFVDFGYADYSIPLGILDWYQARWWGISELTLRWPMIVCGLATLVVFPLYVMGRLGRPTAAIFAVLLAISPLLVVFTRMARPYAITLLAGWIAHAAYQRYCSVAHRRGPAGLVYVVATALATWLHPVAGPFVFAPLLWGFTALRHVARADLRSAFLRWLKLAVAAGTATAVLVLPPLLAHPMSLAAKGGTDLPDLQTWLGVWYAWLGTPSTSVVVMGIALAVCGAPVVWRALPEARTGALGVLLTLALVSASRPMWSHLPVTVSRYLLPFIPLLLLAIAAGMVRIAELVAQPGTAFRRSLAFSALVLPIALLAAQSPLVPSLRRPNGQTQHLVNYIDFRPDHNPYIPQFAAMPLSSFWVSLAARPAGTVRVAAAPFYFESYDWDAPRWEGLSSQSVIPGYLTGLCVDHRAGELPRDPRYRFANAVHLADVSALREKNIDYVAWQKPYTLSVAGHRERMGDDSAACATVLRNLFGPPEFEDSHIIVFPIRRHDPSQHDAPR